MEILEDRMAKVVNFKPSWSVRIQSLMKEAYRHVNSDVDGDYRGIHRDFYPDQFILHEGRLYILDFDLNPFWQKELAYFRWVTNPLYCVRTLHLSMRTKLGKAE